MKRFSIIPALLISTLLGTTAQADTFPSHPIHLIVPFSPGGSTDLVGRLVGAKVAQILGQPVVV
jgi:tripartite-type tricarboxylate transporter receptor subunit TctC